jgi:hypothetical protein
VSNSAPALATESAVRETISQWYARAAVACSPFIFPESRFRMRWEGDELAGPLENARHWLESNPCPDPVVGAHLRAMLVAYGEMPGVSVPRIMELRNTIEQHARAIDRRRMPRDSHSH